jgi:hypothetical protein
MLLEDFKAILLRDIAGLERELDLYPDDASVWKNLSGVPNTAGNLILHLSGNLQHFFGAVLGNTGYVRNREAEFSRRDVPRSELEKELAGSRESVLTAFSKLTESSLEQPYPVNIGDATFTTRLAILHFLCHLTYHLGQMDYHRRVVTGNDVSASVIAASDLVKK